MHHSTAVAAQHWALLHSCSPLAQSADDFVSALQRCYIFTLTHFATMSSSDEPSVFNTALLLISMSCLPSHASPSTLKLLNMFAELGTMAVEPN